MKHEDFVKQMEVLEAERREISKKIESITLAYIETCQFKVGEKVLLTADECADIVAFVKKISLPHDFSVNPSFRIVFFACKGDGTASKKETWLYGCKIKKITS